MKINASKYISLTTVIFVFFTPLLGIFRVSAAALTNMGIAGTGITASSSAVSTGITPTISFQLQTAVVSTDTIQILFTGNGSNNGVTVSSAGLASADITVTGACSGTVTLSGSPIATGTDNPSLTLTGITGATGSVCNVVFAASELSTDSAAGNVSVAVSTSKGDFGAFLYYIGDSNDVSVTAIVPPTLSFVIRNGGDTADLSPAATAGNRVCSLGILQLATTPNPATGVNGCQYRLRIATNATSGYAVSYISDSSDTQAGGFERLAKDADTNIANVAGGGDALTSTVGYGARLTQVSSGHTRGATFTGTSTNYFPITASSVTTMYSSSGPLAPGAAPDTTNTSLVEHGARIAASQEVGNYSHVVTYTVTATF